MLMNRLFAGATALLLTACAHVPIVSNPDEAPNSPWTGAVKSLPELLADKRRAVVFLVHGVGNHCPGFGIDPDKGWLNNQNLPILGLTARTDAAYTEIYDDEFIPNHPHDPASKMTFGVREFDLRITGGSAPIPLTAIEITWSQLTQWIKTNQLGFDLTEATSAPNTTTQGCPYTTTDVYKKPLPREALNRSIKEETLDIDLADAVLYAGEYGRIMRRGLAETLCRALGGIVPPEKKHCRWPEVPPQSERNDTAYFFVTHSLGSRLVYDTLSDLTETDITKNQGTFDYAEMKAAEPFAGYLMAATRSVYMMANQLPMLGLAYEDGSHTSGEDPSPELQVMRAASLYDLKNRAAHPTPDKSATTRNENVSVAPVKFGKIRQATAAKLQMTPSTLTVVAFSDTNDLLSWGIPKWYQRKMGPEESGVEFTNVYVANSTHWLGVIEDPAAAHSNYLTSTAVWNVMHCGANAGKPNTCK
jgi:hypothetical protein